MRVAADRLGICSDGGQPLAGTESREQVTCVQLVIIPGSVFGEHVIAGPEPDGMAAPVRGTLAISYLVNRNEQYVIAKCAPEFRKPSGIIRDAMASVRIGRTSYAEFWHLWSNIGMPAVKKLMAKVLGYRPL